MAVFQLILENLRTKSITEMKISIWGEGMQGAVVSPSHYISSRGVNEDVMPQGYLDIMGVPSRVASNIHHIYPSALADMYFKYIKRLH